MSVPTCIHCGLTKETHGEACKYGKKGFETLHLGGKTCADCAHVYRCVALFGQNADDVRCQFFPVRFLERPPL